MLTDSRTIQKHVDLRCFLAELERRGMLVAIEEPVSLVHEMTALHEKVLRDSGPALLFRRPVNHEGNISEIPVVANLFGTRERIELGLGLGRGQLPRLAEELAELQQPTPPKSLSEAWGKLPLLKAAASMRFRHSRRSPCQEIVTEGEEIDLGRLPIQWCWPGEPAPLVTWPLVITSSPDDPDDINVGVYRMQVRDRNTLIVRWLAHRGGAKHFRQWQRKGLDMPIAVVVGADPATILSGVLPLPEGMSELNFAGLLRGSRTLVTKGLTVPLLVPSHAEIVLEGVVSKDQTSLEGPYGDHTGYYNSVESFPVVRLTAITNRRSPVYLSTFTGRPPDEPSVLGDAMAELFVPIARRHFPEITDIWFPSEACSYRAAVVSIDKRYPGQARRVMMGLWSILPQFNYTKLIIVVDRGVCVRRWEDVIWAISTRFDAARDLVVLENTPIDYLDFASPKAGLGTKMGLDATNKIGVETEREWGRELQMPEELKRRADEIWERAGHGLPIQWA